MEILKPDWMVYESPRCEHGEGPWWDYEEQTLLFVDLLQGIYYELSSNNNICKSSFNLPLGFVIAQRNCRKPVGGFAEGIAETEESEYKKWLFRTEQTGIKIRFNDGKADAAGRLLGGTMTYDGSMPVGKLYSFEKDNQVKVLEEGIYIANGLDWSPDNTVFYFTDTGRHCVYKYDYDLSSGNITDKTLFIQFGSDEYPDGLCTDAAGNLWIAMWQSGKINCFNDRGEKIAELQLPVQYPTSCCFGGKDMTTLFVTTSQLVLTEEQKKEQPLAGCVYACKPGAVGKPLHYFGG
jgi:xylono-1,5-lactonase